MNQATNLSIQNDFLSFILPATEKTEIFLDKIAMNKYIKKFK